MPLFGMEPLHEQIVRSTKVQVETVWRSQPGQQLEHAEVELLQSNFFWIGTDRRFVLGHLKLLKYDWCRRYGTGDKLASVSSNKEDFAVTTPGPGKKVSKHGRVGVSTKENQNVA